MIAQCSITAALAWLLARQLLGHQLPFFAPIAAIITLGLTFGQRLRREAARINHLAYKNWEEAGRVSEQVIREMVSNTLLIEENCIRHAA